MIAPDIAEAARIAQNLASNCNYAVFPCRADKRPATPHGFHDASTEHGAIAEVWRTHPAPLIGIATGAASGVDVLDIDAKHDAARAWWFRHKSRIPPTRKYRTRSGGLHLYFLHADGIGCTASRISDGIDTRGDGGYAIYWFVAGLPCLDHSPPAPWPAWLLELLQPAPPPVRTAQERQHRDPGHTLDGLIRLIRDAPEGQRNARLYWAARKAAEHVQAGRLTAGVAQGDLLHAATNAGLPAKEAARTLRSAWGATR